MPCGCMVFAFSIYSLFASSTYRFSFILSLFLRRRRNIKKNVYFQIRFIYSIQFKLVSFRGQKKVRPRPDWSPFGAVRRASPLLSYGSPPGLKSLVEIRSLSQAPVEIQLDILTWQVGIPLLNPNSTLGPRGFFSLGLRPTTKIPAARKRETSGTQGTIECGGDVSGLAAGPYVIDLQGPGGGRRPKLETAQRKVSDTQGILTRNPT